MTLANIIRRALIELSRGTDAQSTEAWREKLTMFANDAVQDLCEHLELRKEIKSTVTDGALTVPERCLKIVDVRRDGRSLVFNQSPDSKAVSVAEDGEVDVEYRYAPAELKDDIDTPDIPEHLHRLIVSYVVYREHLTADPSMQRRSDAFYQLYESEKRKARKNMGEADTFRIYNTGW